MKDKKQQRVRARAVLGGVFKLGDKIDDPDATVAQLKMREQRLQRKLRQLKKETTP